LAGDAVGLLVESHEGRPTKIEGNPDHPASLGATSAFHQAWILGFCDTDRSQTVKFLGHERTSEDANAACQAALEIEIEEQGTGLRVLIESVVSPTLSNQIEELLEKFPKARWHSYAPISREAAERGAEMAFGAPLAPRYDFRNADVILSLDADFLS